MQKQQQCITTQYVHAAGLHRSCVPMEMQYDVTYLGPLLQNGYMLMALDKCYEWRLLIYAMLLLALLFAT